MTIVKTNMPLTGVSIRVAGGHITAPRCRGVIPFVG